MRTILLVSLTLAWAPVAAANTVAFKSPGPAMHFTEGRPVVVFLDVSDDGANWTLDCKVQCPSGEQLNVPAGGGQSTCSGGTIPTGWPKAQVLADGVLQTDTVSGLTAVEGSTVVNGQGNPTPVDFYRLSVAGLPVGTHQLVGRGLFPEAPCASGGTFDSSPLAVTIDPLPAGKATINLSADYAGPVTWENVIVVGNGHSVSASGALVIKDSLVLGVSSLQGSVTDADIQRSVFEDMGPVDLAVGGGTVQVLDNEWRANNWLEFVAWEPAVPTVLTLRGDQANAKRFQGNRVGAGRMEFYGQSWLIGGDTDLQSNVFIGPRSVLNVHASKTVVRGNYSHHNYRGMWSQGFNFVFGDSSPDLLVEHNFLRGGSWMVQDLTGEFRYNVVYGYGHQWVRSSADGAHIHHNLFLPEDPGGAGEGLWSYKGETGLRIDNNTFDSGGLLGDMSGPTIGMSNASSVASLRNNLITFARDQLNGSPGAARVTGQAGTFGTVDYNAFYSPELSTKDNYSGVVVPGVAEGSPGFAGHDVNGVDGQLQASPFAGARIHPLDDASVVDEGAVWQGTQKLSAVLAAFRARYTPAPGSPVIDAGDPQDNDSQGRRCDVGAIDRDGHDQDKLGRFGDPPAETDPPSVTLTAPTAGATLSGTFTLTATATDGVGVVLVEFLVDGSPVGRDATAPYQLDLDTRRLTAGDHGFAAKAWDAAGNFAISAAVTARIEGDRLAPAAPTGLRVQ